VQLGKHLHTPRGKIDLVISDDVDYSNGWATPFPSNRIGIYVNPPVSESALRFSDDYLQLVVTHELAHIFHLDRVGGIWKVLQIPFGRVPFFFPNAFQPRWLTEGLAVYYESALTGSGRVVGSDHHMVARTAALAHGVPRIDQISTVNPHFPYGASTYIYGSLFVDHLARRYGDRAIRDYVESSARQLIPLWLDWPAGRAFGHRMSSEWNGFTDSLLRSVATTPLVPPLPGWRDLTTHGAYANLPRWLNDTTLVYTGTTGRETYGAYTLLLQSGARQRVGRRHSRSANVRMPDGSLLFHQLEYTSPYTVRSDLYIQDRTGRTRQLTHSARLSVPDASAAGRIVAVQTITAGTRIALVTHDGRTITPITRGALDELWSEPRWSPDGVHIAAVRWLLGGTTEIVVIDTTGRIVQTVVRERTVSSTPSWSPDGRSVYFSSDRDGIANLYRAPFAPGSNATLAGLERVSNTLTGLFDPEVSPTGGALAATVFKADGYHVGVAPLDSTRPTSASAIETIAPRSATPITDNPSPITRYSPWRQLLPRSWMAFTEPALDPNSFRFGALVSGSDIVARHAYQALLFVPSDNSGLTGSLVYRNAIMGQPLLDLSYTQEWTNRGCIVDQANQGVCSGTLRRRVREGTLALTFQRPRYRTFSFFSIGAGVEARDYVSDPSPEILRIDSIYRLKHYYPRTVMSVGWNNVQSPLQAISPEDGVSISTTVRNRWQRVRDLPNLPDSVSSGDYTRMMSTSIVASASAFKSLPLPGFAHHVLALNVAGGYQDSRGTGYFEVGGVSGGSLDILPGYALGEGRRTFGVRGFPAGSLLGIRAYKASAEYRAPLVLPGRGLSTLPLFLERTSITLFGDAGSAWCPGVFITRPAPASSLCTRADVDAGFAETTPHVLASAGAELNVTAAVLSWDAPFRYRLGVAAPVIGRAFVPGQQKPTVYFTVGSSF
jgi:Tol biopolymer transport system component